MKRALRGLTQLVIGLLLIALLAAGVLYVMSERLLRSTYDVEGAIVAVPTDAASIVEGQRLARLRGCYDGCHGEGYGGEPFVDEPFPLSVLLGHIVAPDLTGLADARTDAQLERSIRHGVNQDGRSVLAMPSQSFARLSDEDLSRILASIRSADPAGGPSNSIRLGPMARYFILNGGFLIPAQHIDHELAPPERAPAGGPELGEYLSVTVCSECHGLNLLGQVATGPMPAIPPLSVVAGYTRAQFETLMREGVPASGVELGLMREVALNRFSHFTDRELGALFAHLNRVSTWENPGGSPSQ